MLSQNIGWWAKLCMPQRIVSASYSIVCILLCHSISTRLFKQSILFDGICHWFDLMMPGSDIPKDFFTNKEDEDFMSPKVQKRKKSTLVSQTRTHFKLVHLRVLAGFVGLRRSQVHKDPCRTLQSPQIVDSIPDLLKGNSTYLLTTFLFFPWERKPISKGEWLFRGRQDHLTFWATLNQITPRHSLSYDY